jgi:hypothetical protein
MKVIEQKEIEQTLLLNVEIVLEEGEVLYEEFDGGFWHPRYEWIPSPTRKFKIMKESK